MDNVNQSLKARDQVRNSCKNDVQLNMTQSYITLDNVASLQFDNTPKSPADIKKIDVTKCAPDEMTFSNIATELKV